MSFGRLLLRNLFYHWRGNLSVLLGVVVGTAVLTGALLVGDSLRGSLRDATLNRLGWIDYAMVAGRFFRQDLASELDAHHAAAAIILQGAVSSGKQQSGKVAILGVDDAFWTLTRSASEGPSLRRSGIRQNSAKPSQGKPRNSGEFRYGATSKNALRLLVCLFASYLIAAGSARSRDADNQISNSIGMKLVRIPAGKFVMGSPATEAEREAGEDQHEVAITRPFYLGVYTVTQGQFEQVMGKNPSFFHPRNGGSLDHPAEQVRWNEARQFCANLSALAEEKKLGRTYRLPSEAEWEYACRAGTTTTFHVGDALSSRQANFNGNFPYGGAEKGPFLGRTARVGSYPPNAWGLYDMHGNVYEWCNDWFDRDYYKKSPQENPKGPEQGAMPTGFDHNFFVVVRGGCWLDEGRACRLARRFRLQQSEPYRWTGFRVACDTVGK